MFLLILLYALLASSFTIGKAALSYSMPFFVVGIRFILAGLIVLGYIYFFNTRYWHYNASDKLLLLRFTIFQVYIHYVFSYSGIQYVTSSRASLFFNFAPFITVFLSYFLLAERITWKKITGLIIGFVGIIPIITAGTSDFSDLTNFSYPEILLLISVFGYSYGWILMKELITKRAYSPLMLNGVSMFFGGLAALATSAVFEMPSGPVFLGGESVDILVFIGQIFLLILTSNIIFYNLYPYLLRFYSITFLSCAGLITPVFTALYGYVFLNEIVSYRFFISLFFLAIGLFLFYTEKK